MALNFAAGKPAAGLQGEAGGGERKATTVGVGDKKAVFNARQPGLHSAPALSCRFSQEAHEPDWTERDGNTVSNSKHPFPSAPNELPGYAREFGHPGIIQPPSTEAEKSKPPGPAKPSEFIVNPRHGDTGSC
jgi:hypothetical protein